MIGPILQFEDLQQLCKPGANPRLATVESWAKREGIAYRYDGKGGIWTTQDALNTALGIHKAANSDHPYAPEDIG
ncbi:hypothetical protein PV767_03960 [Stenotrophomonas rhizophila]|uniref:hypothetical protein n=1 Tax=Stenotrophomonas TaxID=40323 RepID=UPI003B79954A